MKGRGWVRETLRGSVEELHARDPFTGGGRVVTWCRPSAPGLALGSGQPGDDADRDACEGAGVAVTRRRTGGGAVLVVPGDLVWVDVVVPPGDPLQDDDVGRAFVWLGRAWAGALAGLGASGLEVHTGGLVRSPWSSRVCFAGLGWGEVTVAGAKLVGLSQRRTRRGVLFQCAVPTRWDPDATVRLLRWPDPAGPAAAGDHLRRTVTGLDRVLPTVSEEEVVAALVGALPAGAGTELEPETPSEGILP